MEKKILDACCGSRMFWFDKTNPNVFIYGQKKGNFDGKRQGQDTGNRSESGYCG